MRPSLFRFSLACRHRRNDRYKYHSLASFMLHIDNYTDVSMSFDLVLFGGTGDLAWRKLMPALFQAFRHGSLPEGGRIIGVARDDLSDDSYRELIQSRFAAVEGAKRPTPEEFKQFASMLYFLRMDLSKPDDYARLASLLNQRDAKTVVMYLATAPALFTSVVEQVAAAGLNTPAQRQLAISVRSATKVSVRLSGSTPGSSRKPCSRSP